MRETLPEEVTQCLEYESVLVLTSIGFSGHSCVCSGVYWMGSLKIDAAASAELTLGRVGSWHIGFLDGLLMLE